MNWYLQVWQKYAEFNGRARRSEYWYFVLFNFLIAIFIAIIDLTVGFSGFLGTIYSLAVLIPSLAVGIRRLHDTGRSGWTILWVLLPIIGAIILLVYMVQDSVQGENEYGVYPK